MDNLFDGRKMNKKIINNIKVYIDKEVKDIDEYIGNNLEDEIQYHNYEYGCRPQKIYILHHIKTLNEEVMAYPDNKGIMILFS
jgi:hypothetical protein